MGVSRMCSTISIKEPIFLLKEFDPMTKILIFIYGVVSYLIFFGAFLYAIVFVGNLFVPKTVDTGEKTVFGTALVINVVLLGIFAVQHSLMARPAFKRWITKIIPQAAERSTYVLLSSLALILLFWQWRPMNDIVWSVSNTIGSYTLWVLFFIGWGTVLLSTVLINHFDLFGLRQVYLNLKGEEYTNLGFGRPVLYGIIRHPIMLGFIIAFWATPVMSTGHLVFAIATTAYILVGIQLEERDMVASQGEEYEKYRREVSMLFPIPKRANSK